MKKLIAAALMLASFAKSAHAVSGTVTLVNSGGVAFSTAISQNLLNFAAQAGVASNLSAQVTFSSANISAQTFIGGQASTATITVVSTQSLVAVAATDTLTVPSTTSILGSPATGYITVIATTGLGGFVSSFTATLSNYSGIAASSPTIYLNPYLSYTYSGVWSSTDTLAHAANTLANAINSGGLFTASVINSTQVQINYISSGTFANGLSVLSSSAPLISTGTWAGGSNPVSITVNNGLQNLTYTYGSNWVSSDTVNHAASTLQTAMNSSPIPNGTDGFGAGVGGAVVAATANVVGTYANVFTMTTSSSALVSVSSSNFSGGLNPILRGAYFSIGGVIYRNGYGWSDVSGTSTGTAASIASFLNSVSTNVTVIDGGFGNVSAVASGQIVKLTAGLVGSSGNAVTIAGSSGSGFTFGSTNFTGGQDNASFTIGSNVFQYPNQWTLGASSTTTSTALSIAAAINSNSGTNSLLIATNVANVVYTTGTVNGAGTNYALTSSTVSLGVIGFTGGLNTAYSSGSATIAIPTHNFTTALPVLYTASAGKSITGLTNQTTYYVVVVDANDIQLATTSALAVSGTGVVLGSTDTTSTSHTYTLTPGPWIQGPASGGFQVSNDGVNWANYNSTAFNVAVSSNIFTPVNPSSTTIQDFGIFDYNYIRYNVTPPTQGGIVLKVILTSKD